MWCRSQRSEIGTPSTRCSLTMATFCWGEKCLRSREFDPFWARSMKSSFAWRYTNAREGKFQFRLRQDITTWAMMTEAAWLLRRISGSIPKSMGLIAQGLVVCLELDADAGP